MAAPHHHHHPRCRSYSTAGCCCCDHNCSCCYGGGSPPPSQQQQTDILFQALAARLLQDHPPQNQTAVYAFPFPSHHQTHCCSQSQPLQAQGVHEHHQRQNQCQAKPRFAVASLLRRIDALEASLRHLHCATATSPPSHSSSSLRDVAARTIQTHFRAFLVRRSRTLGQLKDLAFIKFGVNSLRSFVSDHARPRSEALSYKAKNLLLKLDSIKGGDQMIREGKRSISNELACYLELVNGASVRRAAKSGSFAKNDRKSLRVYEDEDEDDLRSSDYQEHPNDGVAEARNGDLRGRPGLQPKANKTVRFANNGDLSMVLKDVQGACIEDHVELVENMCRELEDAQGLLKGIEEDGTEEERMGNKELPPYSVCETNSGRHRRAEAEDMTRGHFEDPDGDFMFVAPAPLKMESKAELMKKKQGPVMMG